MVKAKTTNLLQRRWQLLLLGGLILFYPIIVVKSYFLTRLGLMLLIYLVAVTGMTLLMRYAGVVSLGSSAFFALGAYVSAILTVRLNINPWLAMAIAGAASIVCGYLFSVPFLKLRRTYLAMATMGLAEVAFLLAKNLNSITGGVSGIAGIPFLRIGPVNFSHDWQIFYLVGCFVLVFVYLTDNVGSTRLGRAYHSIRTNETAAKAMGINVQWELAKVFCFCALACSIAGSLLSHLITFISPESFTLDFAFTLLIIVIIGGANIWGGLITGAVLIVFSEVFRGFQDVGLGFYGFLLIFTPFLFPEGIGHVLFKQKAGAKRRLREPAGLVSNQAMSVSTHSSPSQPREGKILELKNISKMFGGTTALSDVSFSVGYDEIVGIIGPNGAGKTTLLNVVNGFLTPLAGMVAFKSLGVTRKPPHEMARLGLGRTFQLINLFKGMTVIENVMVGSHMKGKAGIFESGLNLPRVQRQEAVIWQSAMNSLTFLGLTEKAFDLVDSLSFGERRLIEMARALSMEPDLLLLDEPAAGLNTAETERLAAIIKQIRDKGIAIVLVEHNMSLVMSVCDKVFVLNFGRGLAFGTPDEISENKEVIEAYLGKEGHHVP
jgi:branched-chain amino acid transport system permease protein